MKVKHLKKLLEDMPDEMPVYVSVGDSVGAFAFAEACKEESGKITLGPPADPLTGRVGEDDEHSGKEVFAILPHGLTDRNEDEIIPEAN